MRPGQLYVDGLREAISMGLPRPEARDHAEALVDRRMADAAEAYQAGAEGFDRWSEHEGTTAVVPSLFHVARWSERGLAAEFQAGWFDAREACEREGF